MTRKIVRSLAALALSAVFFSPNAFATDYTSSQSGPWNLASTWNNMGPPTAADRAIISCGTTVTVSSNEACDSFYVRKANGSCVRAALVISNGYTLTVDHNNSTGPNILGGLIANYGTLKFTTTDQTIVHDNNDDGQIAGYGVPAGVNTSDIIIDEGHSLTIDEVTIYGETTIKSSHATNLASFVNNGYVNGILNQYAGKIILASNLALSDSADTDPRWMVDGTVGGRIEFHHGVNGLAGSFLLDNHSSANTAMMYINANITTTGDFVGTYGCVTFGGSYTFTYYDGSVQTITSPCGCGFAPCPP